MKIVIIGGGIIGATLAYELSLHKGLDILLFEQNTPASASTGAALGVLMGIISHKTKGRLWRLRQNSLERYETLIPELEQLTGQVIPYNRQGILMLRFADEDLESWENLVQTRKNQGYKLEIWDKKQLLNQCPQIQNEKVKGAIYSPRDRQLDPTVLTQALLSAATLRGVNCQLGFKVEKFVLTDLKDDNKAKCKGIQTREGLIELDYLIIAGGLGSTPLTQQLNQPLDIRPVLGQALQVKLDKNLGNPQFKPVITGNNVHIVPLSQGEYWIGATVEFPDSEGEVIPQEELLNNVQQEALSFCPELKNAKILKKWTGKRPRPQVKAAPVIEFLPGYENVILATGHYRNGVLLAPGTALEIQNLIIPA